MLCPIHRWPRNCRCFSPLDCHGLTRIQFEAPPNNDNPHSFPVPQWWCVTWLANVENIRYNCFRSITIVQVSPLSSTNRFWTWPLDRHSIAAYLALNSIAIASVSLELRAFSRVDVELTVRQVTAQLNKSSPQERQPAFHSPDFVKRIFSSSSIKKKFTIPFCTFWRHHSLSLLQNGL